MKMAKKLLAVVLTGVMALSMLTGCALSDKVKAEALEKALNSDAAQAQTASDTVDVTYKYDNDLNGKATAIWTGATSDQMMDKKIPNTIPATLTTVTISGKKYAYLILTAPEKKDAKDKLEWVGQAKKFDGVVDVAGNIDATASGKVHNYAAAGAKKVKFGVKFVDNGLKGDQKKDYAIVVVEVNA